MASLARGNRDTHTPPESAKNPRRIYTPTYMPEPPTNGTGRHATTGLLATLGERIITVLPPAFLLLVLLNIAFLAVAAWTFSHNTEVRNAMITRIIDACLLERKQQQ